ncbi:MAG: NAD(P)/FAD-dependent oxidoreductase [Phycisphaerales bacterium JB052]
MDTTNDQHDAPDAHQRADRPSVLIVGGGFGGLAVARALAGADADITVIDKQNHHVFQPLLYQVATASLSPATISQPIRTILRGQDNCGVVLANATGVDAEHKKLLFESGDVGYDYLVLAAGASHDYFGHDEWAPIAPGLKTLSDATEIRRRLLLAFEEAEHEGDEAARRAALTFAVIGGGPTGVELSGAIKEIAGQTLPSEYHNIDTKTTRVLLFEGSDRLLNAFPPQLSERAKRDLELLGVEVRVNALVDEVTEDGIRVGDEFIETKTVFWAAGVRASHLGESLGVPVDRSRRVIVEPDLSIPGHPEVFVIGDMSSLTPEGADHPLPGVAQTAMQMGQFVGKIIAKEIADGLTPSDRPKFVYKDKGSMAIIGKNRAVATIGSRRFAGFIAWVLWAFVHIAFLVGFRNRIRVLFNWGVKWLLNSHDARLIVGDTRMHMSKPTGRGFTPKQNHEN